MADKQQNAPREVNAASELQVRRDKLKTLCEEGKNPFTITKYDRDTTSSALTDETFAEMEGKTVRIAGRMVSRRIMGKASFFHLLDADGKIDPQKLRPITYDSMNQAYLVLGEKVGNAFRDGKKLIS